MKSFIEYFRKDRWSPYVVGVLVGLLSWITFGFMGKALGVSTTFVHITGFLTSLISAEHVENLTYYQEKLSKTPLINWQFMLVVGTLIGSWLASALSQKFYGSTMPTIWVNRFGPSKGKLYFASFIGGIILMFGARLAGGCSSGHGLSGGIQLAVSSWIFLVSFFVSGYLFSQIFYKKRS